MRPQGFDILVTSLAPEAQVRDLVVTESAEYDPALSPSGRWLAYVSDRTGRPEIWVKRYPDGVPVRISSDGGVEPRWSRDESELFYLQGIAMMAVALQTEAELEFDPAEQLFAEPFSNNVSPTTHSYDVAPDGRFLMIQPAGRSVDGQSLPSIVVVQNWLTELERLTPND
jgi:Tol biopolymer transport system component